MSSINYYIHKPKTVFALQWKGKSDKAMYDFLTEGDENAAANTESSHNDTFIIYANGDFSFYMAYREQGDKGNINRLIIKTDAWTNFNISIGDYVIRDEKGKYTILSEEEFDDKYETPTGHFRRYGYGGI